MLPKCCQKPFLVTLRHQEFKAKSDIRAPVAQWIEHRSSEPRVVGSNPSGRTTFQIQIEAIETIHKLLFGRVVNRLSKEDSRIVSQAMLRYTLLYAFIEP